MDTEPAKPAFGILGNCEELARRVLAELTDEAKRRQLDASADESQHEAEP